MLNIEDFHFIRQGIPIHTLTKADEHWFAPVHIEKPGRQRALLLLHGFGSTPAVYRALLPTLTEHYDAVVCPALPGHCANLDVFADATSLQWQDAAAAALEPLLNQYQHVDVLGLSLGGLIACELSQKYPLHHLYLLAPAFALKQIYIRPTLLAACLLQCIGIKKLMNYGGNLHTEQHAELLYRQLPLTTIQQMLHFVKQFSWVPPSCPTDLFLGYFDAVVDSAKIAKRFAKQPHMTIHWLMRSAHVLPLDGDIDYLLDTLTARL